MQITHHKPAARGVSQLMYVGDDQALETATTIPWPLKAALALGITWLIFRRR